MEQLMEQISGGKSEPGHVGMAENSLLKLAAPYLENLDPQRVASVASVFRRLEILQKEGVVLTMFDKRANLAQQVMTELKNYFGDKLCHTTVPRNIRLAEAPSHGQPR